MKNCSLAVPLLQPGSPGLCFAGANGKSCHEHLPLCFIALVGDSEVEIYFLPVKEETNIETHELCSLVIIIN